MKRHILSAVLMAAALGAAGAAGAADQSTGSGSANGPSLGDRAKSTMHRIGDATKNAWHKVTGKDAGSDTRSMGAGADTTANPGTGDSARQKRMDDAYGNYQSGAAKK